MATSKLDHPLMGSIIGNAEMEDVTRFLGLQYATLADRFAPSRMKEYSQDDTVDATIYGYASH